MKAHRYLILLLMVLSTEVALAETITIPADQLSTFRYEERGLVLDSFQIEINSAVFGGQKAELRFAAHNKSEDGMNYTIYALVHDEADELICAFHFQPFMRSHVAGATESFYAAGMVCAERGIEIKPKRLVLKLVRQR